MLETRTPRAPISLDGRHVLAELVSIDFELLDDEVRLREAFVDALVESGCDVRNVVSEAFAPQGVTMVALLAQSHASVHTWPEHGTAQIDVFTCGDMADPEHVVDLLAAALKADIAHVEVVRRGPSAHSVVEPIAPGLSRRWDLSAVHHVVQTPFQRVVIADTAHGVTLFCDEERQSAESTQLTYHEALFVPAMLLASQCESVLIIGSSEGVVSQLAASSGATRVDHVDIDRDCVRACATHLPYGYDTEQLAAAESHEGVVRVHYDDGVAFVERCSDRYDIVVIDLPDERPGDPDAQLNRLYTPDFLAQCANLLRPGGVVVSQAGNPALWRHETLRASVERFEKVFPQVVSYNSDEHEWTFLVGLRDPITAPVEQMIQRLGRLPFEPATIDATALRSGSILPFSLRH